MSRLPVVSGKKTVKAFEQIGYRFDHQTGSHMILRHVEPPHRRLTITKKLPKELSEVFFVKLDSLSMSLSDYFKRSGRLFFVFSNDFSFRQFSIS